MFFARGFTTGSTSLASILLLATCSLPTLNALVLERDPNTASLTERSKFSGFLLEEESYLDHLELPASCKNALVQTILCDDYISDYGDPPKWRGYVDTNETSYESVCDASCGASIHSYWDGIVKECAGYIYQEEVTLNLGAGRLWEAWNETCYYDPESGRNCNEIINEFSAHNGTCTYCNVEHYKMMRNSPYSAYDEVYQIEFEDINRRCGLNNDITFPLEGSTPGEVVCTSTGYKIQEGDTCASIAEKFNISSEDVRISYASSYGGLPLPTVDCDDLGWDSDICIPQSSQNGEVVPADEKSASSTDINSSTSAWVSATQISSSSTSTTSSAAGSITSSQSTGMVSMATSRSSVTSGAKLTAQTAGSSASATPSVSVDNVSAASMIGLCRSQIVAIVIGLVVCQMM